MLLWQGICVSAINSCKYCHSYARGESNSHPEGPVPKTGASAIPPRALTSSLHGLMLRRWSNRSFFCRRSPVPVGAFCVSMGRVELPRDYSHSDLNAARLPLRHTDLTCYGAETAGFEPAWVLPLLISSEVQWAGLCDVSSVCVPPGNFEIPTRRLKVGCSASELRRLTWC